MVWSYWVRFLGELEPLIVLWTSSGNLVVPVQSSCSISIEPCSHPYRTVYRYIAFNLKPQNAKA